MPCAAWRPSGSPPTDAARGRCRATFTNASSLPVADESGGVVSENTFSSKVVRRSFCSSAPGASRPTTGGQLSMHDEITQYSSARLSHAAHAQHHVPCVSMESLLTTDRLVIRDWSVDDAAAALKIYGFTEVIRWLTPAMDRITDLAAMRSVLQAWSEPQPNLTPPRGRWAVQAREGDDVIGRLAIRLLPPTTKTWN